jgi:hypothetical protein
MMFGLMAAGWACVAATFFLAAGPIAETLRGFGLGFVIVAALGLIRAKSRAS